MTLEELRAWYEAAKSTPECKLALKHRHAMAPGVAETVMPRADGQSAEEWELTLLRALHDVAAMLDPVEEIMGQAKDAIELGALRAELHDVRSKAFEAVHMAGVEIDRLSAELDAERAKSASVDIDVEDDTVPAGALVPASHVDIESLRSGEIVGRILR